MAESISLTREWDPDLPQVEQWVRRAGTYLDVSDDLRPRVLEQAREQQVRRRSFRWAAALLLVLFAMGSGLQRLGTHWQASPASVVDEAVCLNNLDCLSNLDIFTRAAAELRMATDAPDAWTLACIFLERHRRARPADLASDLTPPCFVRQIAASCASSQRGLCSGRRTA